MFSNKIEKGGGGVNRDGDLLKTLTFKLERGAFSKGVLNRALILYIQLDDCNYHNHTNC